MTEIRKVITQGEHAASDDPALVISTLLGSCVACCLWDPLAGVGGVNHMLVAQRTDGAQGRGFNDAGVTAMEVLINDIVKRGGVRKRLVAKVFGGARMVEGLSDIGAANSAFTFDYLQREAVPCVSQSVGGQQARHLLFWPATGTARQKFVPASTTNLRPITPARLPQAPSNGLELF